MSAVQVAQLDATGRTVTLIVLGLLAAATALALLTAWYWRITDPRRSDTGSKPTPPGRPPGSEPPTADGPDGGRSAAFDTAAASEADGSADQTRVFERQAIVSRPEPSDQPPAGGDPSSPAASVPAPPQDQQSPPMTPRPDEQDASPPDHDQTIIDLRDSPQTEPTKQKRRTAENESGLTFEEWLALAEEDR